MLKQKIPGSKRCLGLVAALLVCSSLPVYAIEAPDAGKTAGSLEEQKLTMPDKANVKIEISQEQTTAPRQAQGPKIQVKGIHITGQTIYSEDQLQAVVKDAVDQELSLSDLQGVAERIAKYLHEQGYIVAAAYLPRQEVKDGMVEITVALGQYGSIDIRNHSRLSDGKAAGMLSSIKPGDYVQNDILERTLLLLSDTSGVSAHATLAPGKTSGTTDLIVEIIDTAKTMGQFTMDNYGNRFTGKNRAGLNLNINNLSGSGDTAFIGGTLTDDSDMDNINLGYLSPIGDKGFKLGVGYTKMHYTLGEDFADLDASGEAETTSLYGVYPLVRTRDHNLYGYISYDHKKLKDSIGDTLLASDKQKHANVWTVGLNGSNRDKLGGGGLNSFALAVANGRLHMDTADALEGDDTALTAGSYTKTSLALNRLQYVNDRVNLYFGLTGQLANKNLDSSEKLILGGATGVRAYPQGEAAGDQGYLMTGELRWNLPTPSVQLAAYIDNGHVKVNKNTWPDAGDNSRTLTGAGLGLIFNRDQDYTLRLDYAWKMGSSDATSDTDKNGRFWIQGIYRF